MKKVLTSLAGLGIVLFLTGCVVDPYGYSTYDYDVVGVPSVSYYDSGDYYPNYYKLGTIYSYF